MTVIFLDGPKACPDCGAELQVMPFGRRCPWSTATSRHAAKTGGITVISCGRPYRRYIDRGPVGLFSAHEKGAPPA